MSTEQTFQPTGCTNKDCEHSSSCYRAYLSEHAPPGVFVVEAFFSRDPMLAQSRGFDCYWPLKERKQA